MLGFIGFTIAALIIGFFAISFYRSFTALNEHQRGAFSAAFLLLSAAFFIWGFAPLINDADTTKLLVLAGDGLLLVGSGLLVLAQFKKLYLIPVIVLAIAGAVLLGLRAYIFEPAATVSDGLLHFNLEGEARVTLLAILTFVWVPLGARITQLAVQAKGVPQFSGIVTLIFVASLVCAALFLGARQNVTVIASFAALALSFLLMAFIPLLIGKYARVVASAKKGARSGK